MPVKTEGDLGCSKTFNSDTRRVELVQRMISKLYFIDV